ncbi:MAG: HindIII family type II restriction endonuclease [Ekhidna sp.]|nr:HindIII family type II restriction endonuclease [Ekhidna sp.]
MLHEIFKTIAALNPSKNAIDYWLAINKAILGYSRRIDELWKIEKEAATESTEIAKKEGLFYLASERERTMKMSHDDALRELVKMRRIDSKIKTIKAISDFGIFSIN